MIIKLVLSVVVISLTAYFLVELWTPRPTKTVYLLLNESVSIPPNVTLEIESDTIIMGGSNTDNPVVIKKDYRHTTNSQIRELKSITKGK